MTRKHHDGEEAENLAALEATFKAVDRARDARGKRNEARFDARQVTRVVEWFATHTAQGIEAGDPDVTEEAKLAVARVRKARTADAEAEGAWRSLRLSRSIEAAEAARKALFVAACYWRDVQATGLEAPWDSEAEAARVEARAEEARRCACPATCTKDGGETLYSCRYEAGHEGPHHWKDAPFARVR